MKLNAAIVKKYLTPSVTDDVFIFCLFLAGIGRASSLINQDGDTGTHIRSGEIMLSTHTILTSDPFSFTRFHQMFIAWEWLSEIIFAQVYDWLGLNGLVMLIAVFISLAIYGVWRTMRSRGVPVLLCIPLIIAVIGLTSVHWLARPHIFSFFLTWWWANQTWKYWETGNSRYLWPLPLVLLIWVNLHVGYTSGLILIGTVLIAHLATLIFQKQQPKTRLKHILITLVICSGVTLMNPWGINEPLHMLSFVRDSYIMNNVQEYEPLPLQSPAMILFLFMFALWALTMFLRKGKKRIDLYPLLTVFVWTLLAASAARAVPLWALVVVPIIAESLYEVLKQFEQSKTDLLRRQAKNFLELCTPFEKWDSSLKLGVWSLILFILIFAYNLATPVQFSPQIFPVAAINNLKAQGIPAGNMFDEYSWGGYIEYALPQKKVFIDGRNDFFGDQITQDYATIYFAGKGWQSLLDKYYIRWVLVAPSSPLVKQLEKSPGWSCYAGDSMSTAEVCRR